MYQAKSEEVGEALIENIITKFGMPDYIMMDQDHVFMSSLMSYLFKKLKITIKTVGPYNHKSLQAEHGIKSLSKYTVQTFNRLRTNVAQIPILSHILVQHIPVLT